MRKLTHKLGLMSLLIGLCASASATINGFDASIKFPEQAKTVRFLQANFYANESDLNNMQPGLNKDQVRLLIGNPPPYASMITAHTWDYIFKFRELDKASLICQYQVQFDDQKKVAGSYFDSQACVDHLHPPLKVNANASAPLVTNAGDTAQPQPAAVPLPASLHLSIPTNMLFGFNQSELKDLPAAVKDTLRAFVDQLKANDTLVDSIIVTGYSDRIGDDAYNLKLSTARAESVKGYFVLRGIDVAKVIAEGKGNSAPLVQCSDTNKKKLVACLAPNRRVDIEYKLK